MLKAAKCIAKLLENAREGHFRLFYLDETIAIMWATLCKVWARKGSRPEIPMGDGAHLLVGGVLQRK